MSINWFWVTILDNKYFAMMGMLIVQTCIIVNDVSDCKPISKHFRLRKPLSDPSCKPVK
jgi:hypothetical protein